MRAGWEELEKVWEMCWGGIGRNEGEGWGGVERGAWEESGKRGWSHLLVVMSNFNTHSDQ